MRRPDCSLGIDVGGTNTDAVIMDRANKVLAKAKVPGTPDVTGGVTAAIDAVLKAPGVEARRITHVMLGTTHATNAVLERSGLRRVAVIRIGAPATHSIRPMFEWPRDLAKAVSVGAVHDDRVGVRAADVDAEPAVRPRHWRAPRQGRSRSHNRTSEDLPRRAHVRCARSGRRRTRSR